MVQATGPGSHWADQQILERNRQIRSALRLVRWLQGRYEIPTGDVIGHSMANDNPHFKDLAGLAQRPHRLAQAGRARVPTAPEALRRGRARAVWGCSRYPGNTPTHLKFSSPASPRVSTARSPPRSCSWPVSARARSTAACARRDCFAFTAASTRSGHPGSSPIAALEGGDARARARARCSRIAAPPSSGGRFTSRGGPAHVSLPYPASPSKRANVILVHRSRTRSRRTRTTSQRRHPGHDAGAHARRSGAEPSRRPRCVAQRRAAEERGLPLEP